MNTVQRSEGASDLPELEIQAKCELSRVGSRTLLELLVLQGLCNYQATLHLPGALLQLSLTTTEHRQASPDPLWSLGVAVQMLSVVLFRCVCVCACTLI